MSRLYLEATLRRTPLPQSERGLATAGSFLLDELTYQQRPAELALQQPPAAHPARRRGWPRQDPGDRPHPRRADQAGPRRPHPRRHARSRSSSSSSWSCGPGSRSRSSGWTRSASSGSSGRSRPAATRSPTTSGSSSPSTRSRTRAATASTWTACTGTRWSSTSRTTSIGSSEKNLRNRLARRLAPRTDALLLASATPHNGDARVVRRADRHARPGRHRRRRRTTRPRTSTHLYIRRTKISREVTNEIGGKWPDRGPSVPIRCPASPAEEAVFAELTDVWLADPAKAPGAGTDRRLFPYILLKAFLSSHKALAQTARKRAKNTGDDDRAARRSTRLAAPRRPGHRRRLRQAHRPGQRS